MGVIAKQSIKGALANYLGVLIGAVTTFFVVTDLLTREEIGLTRVMVDAAMLFAGLAQLGTNSSILRFYPRFHTPDKPELRDHGFFGWTLLLPLAGFSILAVLFFIFKDNIVAYYAEEAPLLVDFAYLLLPLTFFVLYMTVFETNASVLLHIALPKFVREVLIRVLNLVAYLLYGFSLLRNGTDLLKNILIIFILDVHYLTGCLNSCHRSVDIMTQLCNQLLVCLVRRHLPLM